MQFGATPEQDMIVETVRSFVEQEIYPLESKIEKLGYVPKDIAEDVKTKVLVGLHNFDCDLIGDIGTFDFDTFLWLWIFFGVFTGEKKGK